MNQIHQHLKLQKLRASFNRVTACRVEVNPRFEFNLDERWYVSSYHWLPGNWSPVHFLIDNFRWLRVRTTPLAESSILKMYNKDDNSLCVSAPQMLMVQSVVADINRRTGESECQYYKDRLLYTEDGLKDALIDQSRTLCCHGELKNNRGLVSRFL